MLDRWQAYVFNKCPLSLPQYPYMPGPTVGPKNPNVSGKQSAQLCFCAEIGVVFPCISSVTNFTQHRWNHVREFLSITQRNTFYRQA